MRIDYQKKSENCVSCMSCDMRDMQLSASVDPCDPLDMQIDYQKEEKNCVMCHVTYVTCVTYI